ncbi:hypothetical protein X777_07558 [Ooceraea biroi]|uniref:Uncharacterized protein n=1 Tax=Ooceraea biroi TaxID=2015173 RepID=A0A026X3A7_OOCBI|nr:hypothetical protein X777_07558 [Ooceraea biroi]
MQMIFKDERSIDMCSCLRERIAKNLSSLLFSGTPCPCLSGAAACSRSACHHKMLYQWKVKDRHNRHTLKRARHVYPHHTPCEIGSLQLY